MAGTALDASAPISLRARTAWRRTPRSASFNASIRAGIATLAAADWLRSELRPQAAACRTDGLSCFRRAMALGIEFDPRKKKRFAPLTTLRFGFSSGKMPRRNLGNLGCNSRYLLRHLESFRARL